MSDEVTPMRDQLREIYDAASRAARTLSQCDAAVLRSLDVAARSAAEAHGILAAIPGKTGWAEAVPFLGRMVEGVEAADRANLAAHPPRIMLGGLAAVLMTLARDQRERADLSRFAGATARAPETTDLAPIARRLRDLADHAGQATEISQVAWFAGLLAERRQVAHKAPGPEPVLAAVRRLITLADAADPAGRPAPPRTLDRPTASEAPEPYGPAGTDTPTL